MSEHDNPCQEDVLLNGPVEKLKVSKSNVVNHTYLTLLFKTLSFLREAFEDFLYKGKKINIFVYSRFLMKQTISWRLARNLEHKALF